MGLIISKFRKKPSTKELLEKIQKDVAEIEEYREHTQQRQKRLVGSLVLYSIILYLVAALICYLYYFPTQLQQQLLFATPFIIFPFLIYLLKRLLTWYYRRKLTKNEDKLKKLFERKEIILEQVMETETYKVAKEILEKYAPDQLRKNQMHKMGGTPAQLGQPLPTPSSQHPGRQQSQDIRRRIINSSATPQVGTLTGHGVRPVGPGAPHQTPAFTPRPLLASPHTTPARPVLGMGSVRTASLSTPLGPGQPRGPLPPVSSQSHNTPAPTLHSTFHRGGLVSGEGGGAPPGPPMPRPVLPRERGYLDRFIEYLVGDGPANRFALVCRQCESHNGMALKDEFQYLAFRCAYCFYWNPAKKQRPAAPRLEALAPQLPPSLHSAQEQDQEEEEEEEEEQDSSSGEEEEEEGVAEEESEGSSSSGEEEEEEEGVGSSEVSSTKAASSQEGSLEDLAKSTPSSDITNSDDQKPEDTMAFKTGSPTASSAPSTTPSSTTENEEPE